MRANEELGAALGLRYHLNGTPGSDFELATRMGLLPSNPDQADYSDFWEGTFGNSEGTLHEAHLQEYQQQGKHRRLVTVFQGVVMGYQFARPFTSTTLVRQDMGLLNGLFNFGSRMTGLKLEAVKMVHPDFERRFEVVSTDQVKQTQRDLTIYRSSCAIQVLARAFVGRSSDGNVYLSRHPGCFDLLGRRHL